MGIRIKPGITFAAVFCLLPAAELSALSSGRESRIYAHYLKAAVAERLGEKEASVKEYLRAEKLDPGSSRIHLNLGAQYLSLNKLDLALEELKTAVESDPADLEARFNLALVHLFLKNNDEAVKQYEVILKARLESEPDNSEIIISLAQIYYQQGKINETIGEYRRLTQLMPDKAEAYVFLGELFSQAGDLDSGIASIKKALTLKPDYPEADNSLAYLYALKGENLDEALGLARRALKDNADKAAYIDTLGWVYFKKGLLDEAIAQLERAVKILEDPVIYGHLADVYFARGLPDEAEKAWHKSLDLDPSQDSVRDKLKLLKK